jgi:universal stress protein E
VRRIRRILVAVKEPAAGAPAAVTKAAQLARALGAELVLFQALSAPLYVDGDVTLLNDSLAAAERSRRDACLARLERIARRLRRANLKVAVCAEWDYPVYDAVIREATRRRADLIVAERHAGSHLAASFLHLTDWELLRNSPLPLLLVKRSGAYRHPVILAAVDPEHSYDKPARLDTEIARTAAALAALLGGHLHAVHAYVPLPVTAFARGTVLTDQEVARLESRAAASAREKVDRLLRRARVPKPRLHVVSRHPADAIEQVAAQSRSAIVVMGAIARTGLKRLLIGNTAEKVLDHLPCDVLIVKPARLTKPVPRSRRGARYVSGEPTAATLV